jgi:hypothetical protein
LEQHPEVRQAVVVVREDTPGDKRLAGYVVPTPGASLDVAALRPALRAALPAYMLPTTLTVLETLPLTPNGKVDRKALPAPSELAPAAARQVNPPRDPVQHAIAAMWQETLGIPTIGIDDNFFDLGGHSLLILQVHARICAAFETDLTVAEMFQFPTVQELAARVQRTGRAARGVDRAQGRIRRLREEQQRDQRPTPERQTP